MPELRQEYLDILEKREWSVSGYTDDGRVELEWWSPAGEDFLVCVNVENFPDEILDYSDDFDPDEHRGTNRSVRHDENLVGTFHQRYGKGHAEPDGLPQPLL